MNLKFHQTVKFIIVALSIGALLLTFSGGISRPIAEAESSFFSGPIRTGHGWPWSFVVCVEACTIAWGGVVKNMVLHSAVGGLIYGLFLRISQG